MTLSQQEQLATELKALDAKVKAMLPAQYQHCYTSVSPKSMGSTSLKYGPDGMVRWDRIWTTFCDLALAGGPPHRGKLLETVPPRAGVSEVEQYEQVVAEIRRGIELTTGLPTAASDTPGWVGVRCSSLAEVAWLQFAVLAENVSVRRRDTLLYLPAGSAFRIDKEIKNVVVALAKTHHYWEGHLTSSERSLGVVEAWEAASLDEATSDSHRTLAEAVEMALRASGLATDASQYVGWVGVAAPDETAAVWLMRAVLVEGVFARREGATLYLPVGASGIERADEVVRAFTNAFRLWSAIH